MNYADITLYNSCCSEWTFYFNKILGNANINQTKKDLIDFLLTPTYYLDNKVYFDYRATIVSILITSTLYNIRENISYVLQLKEDENNYEHVDPVLKNEYSIYQIILLVSLINNWKLESNLLINIQPKEYKLDLIIYDKYITLSQLDLYLNTNMANELWGLYERTYILK